MKKSFLWSMAFAALWVRCAVAESVVPVHSGKIVRTTLHGYEVAYGRIEAAPASAEHPAGRLSVSAAVDGVLVRIACGPGQAVKKGDPLFQLDDRVAKMAVQERDQTLAFAKKVFERQKQLIEIDGTSEREYQQAARDFHQAEQALAAAQVRLDYQAIRAPAAGTLVQVAATRGEAVTAGRPLASLLVSSRRAVSIRVPAEEMDSIRPGQPVQLSDGADWLDAGSIGFVAEEVDPANGTVEVRAPLPAGFPWRVGRLVQARVLRETHADCLAVPVAALVTDPDGGTYVAMLSGDRAQRVPVVGKLREGGWVEVEGEGLAEGAAIATEGAYGLPDGTRVELIGQ